VATKTPPCKLEVRNQNDDSNPNSPIRHFPFELQSVFGLRDSCFTEVVLSWLQYRFRGEAREFGSSQVGVKSRAATWRPGVRCPCRSPEPAEQPGEQFGKQSSGQSGGNGHGYGANCEGETWAACRETDQVAALNSSRSASRVAAQASHQNVHCISHRSCHCIAHRFPRQILHCSRRGVANRTSNCLADWTSTSTCVRSSSTDLHRSRSVPLPFPLRYA
jgi:hypothetical protein